MKAKPIRTRRHVFQLRWITQVSATKSAMITRGCGVMSSHRIPSIRVSIAVERLSKNHSKLSLSQSKAAFASHLEAIAAALNAKRMLMLTDVQGVLDKNGKLISSLKISEAEALIHDGTVRGAIVMQSLRGSHRPRHQNNSGRLVRSGRNTQMF
ncbi:MAG: hypothetical protein EBU18_06510 [Rhodobacteraceae bacterium]|nr:hypothetical protein [Paracoccaceae bacterium]